MTNHIELWQPCEACKGTGYVGFAYCACHGTSRHDGYRPVLVPVGEVVRMVMG